MKRLKRSTALALIILLLVTLSACGDGETAASPTSIGNPQAGRQIYENGKGAAVPCASCHTLDGLELVGPSFQGMGERAGERIPDLSAEEYLRQSITDSGAHLVEGYEDTMPKNYTEELSEEDIDNLIAFLMNQ